jgi:hypothetical protein
MHPIPWASALGLLCCGVALSGCGSDATVEPTGPTSSGLDRPLQKASGTQQQVTGSAFISLDGVPERITFSAIRHQDGRVSGQFQLFTEQIGGVRLHGIITCLGIDGTLARLGGEVTQSSPPGFESGAIWAVIDNGEGAGAPPDESTDMFVFTPPEVVEEFCTGGLETPFLVPFHSARGNIQVHP